MHAYNREQTGDKPKTNDCLFDAYSEAEEDSPQRDENGTYCWTYEMELLQNHAYLLFLMRLILIPCGIVFALVLAVSFRSGASFRHVLMGYGIILAVLAGVAVIIWITHLLIALASDNRCLLRYEMNDREIALGQGESRSVSEFRKVRTVRIDRENHRIFLNSPFLYNMICCEGKDFDFVAEYIVDHCPDAWIIGR